MSKKAKIILSISGVLIVLLLSLGAWLWYAQSQMYVKIGFAQDKFPYKFFSVQEMAGMYKQEPLEGIATTQTPEQTHAKFIEALKKGDIDGAVECCVVKGEREKMKEGFIRIKEQKLLDSMIKDLDTEIIVNVKGDSQSTYDYFVKKDGKSFANAIIFQKNLQGVWLIESF